MLDLAEAGMVRMPWLVVAALLAAGGSAAAQTSASAELAPGVTATVTSLKRLPHDGLVQIDYRIDNAGTSAVSLDDLGLMTGGNDCVEGVGLIDFAGEQHYQVGGTAGGCLSSSVTLTGDTIGAGQSFEGWAWFRPPSSASGPFAVRFARVMPILNVPLQ